MFVVDPQDVLKVGFGVEGRQVLRVQQLLHIREVGLQGDTWGGDTELPVYYITPRLPHSLRSSFQDNT